MKGLKFLICCAMGITTLTAFAPRSTPSRTRASLSPLRSSETSNETEAERLLRKARELRAAAAREEQKVHGDLTEKKSERDRQTDALIEELLFGNQDLVGLLRKKRLSMTTLERIVLRLDERQLRAQGWEHVQGKTVDGRTEFVRVSKEDPDTLARLEGKIEQFIDAVEVLDAEFRDQKQKKGQSFVAHAEEEHWGGGKCAKYLRDRIKEIRRERSEHFQARMKDLQESQRRKEDHKFDGYNDLGTLN